MKRMRILLAAAGVLAVGYFACCAAVDGEYILPHTSVNGIDISGMNEQEAMERLGRDADARKSAAVIDVRFAGQEYPVAVGNAIEWRYRPIVEEMLKTGQSAFFARGYFFIRSYFAGNNRKAAPALESEEALEQAIKSSGLSDAGTTTQTVYQVKEDCLSFTMGTAGEEPDIEKLKEELRYAALKEDYTVLECPVADGKVEALDLDLLYREIYREPENASLDPENNYQIKESVTGVRFDQEIAGNILEETAEGSTVTVDLIFEEPEITTANLKEHLFADQLAVYTTRVGGTANRKDNVSLAAEKCNGIILLSGDIFSYNDTVGEQTAETGYKLANAVMDGKIVQAYGGGICQVSSTIFAAALYADLEIKERWEHELVPGYIDAGMDAAVSWDTLDFKICNDQKYPVRMDTIYADGNLTVTIRGTKTDDSIVEIDTKTVDDSDGKLCVQTYRKVYNGDKSQMVIEKAAYSTYLN